MSIFSRLFHQDSHQNHAILQRSAVEYFDMTAYVSLIFSDGQRTLKASEIKEFSFSRRLGNQHREGAGEGGRLEAHRSKPRRCRC